jgi:hypothetical protein
LAALEACSVAHALRTVRTLKLSTCGTWTCLSLQSLTAVAIVAAHVTRGVPWTLGTKSRSQRAWGMVCSPGDACTTAIKQGHDLVQTVTDVGIALPWLEVAIQGKPCAQAIVCKACH